MWGLQTHAGLTAQFHPVIPTGAAKMQTQTADRKGTWSYIRASHSLRPAVTIWFYLPLKCPLYLPAEALFRERTFGISPQSIRGPTCQRLGRELLFRFTCPVLCSSTGLWSLCEMSTGVNEYPLSQSPGNPANKMPPLIDKICHNTRRETTGIQLSTTQGFFMLWCLSLHFFISLFCNTLMKLGAVIIGGFVAGSGNETVYLLLNLPFSVVAPFLSHFIRAPFFRVAARSLSLHLSFFPICLSLPLRSSSPPRLEPVIGWYPLYNPLWWQNAFFSVFIMHHLNLHFKTLLSFPPDFGRRTLYSHTWVILNLAKAPLQYSSRWIRRATAHKRS